MSTEQVTKEGVIKALKGIFDGHEVSDSRFDYRGDAAELFFERTKDSSLTEQEIAEEYPTFGPALRGVIWRTVLDDLEGEGGPSQQRAVTRFTLPSGEVFFVQAIFTWVSWDGFYYDDVSGTIKEVHPKEKVIIEYA